MSDDFSKQLYDIGIFIPEEVEKHLGVKDSRRAVRDLVHPIPGVRAGQQEHAHGAVGLGNLGANLIGKLMSALSRAVSFSFNLPDPTQQQGYWYNSRQDFEQGNPAHEIPSARAVERMSSSEAENLSQLMQDVFGFSPTDDPDDAEKDLINNIKRIMRGNRGEGEEALPAEEVDLLEIYNAIESYYQEVRAQEDLENVRRKKQIFLELRDMNRGGTRDASPEQGRDPEYTAEQVAQNLDEERVRQEAGESSQEATQTAARRRSYRRQERKKEQAEQAEQAAQDTPAPSEQEAAAGRGRKGNAQRKIDRVMSKVNAVLDARESTEAVNSRVDELTKEVRNAARYLNEEEFKEFVSLLEQEIASRSEAEDGSDDGWKRSYLAAIRDNLDSVRSSEGLKSRREQDIKEFSSMSLADQEKELERRITAIQALASKKRKTEQDKKTILAERAVLESLFDIYSENREKSEVEAFSQLSPADQGALLEQRIRQFEEVNGKKRKTEKELSWLAAEAASLRRLVDIYNSNVTREEEDTFSQKISQLKRDFPSLSEEQQFAILIQAAEEVNRLIGKEDKTEDEQQRLSQLESLVVDLSRVTTSERRSPESPAPSLPPSAVEAARDAVSELSTLETAAVPEVAEPESQPDRAVRAEGAEPVALPQAEEAAEPTPAAPVARSRFEAPPLTSFEESRKSIIESRIKSLIEAVANSEYQQAQRDLSIAAFKEGRDLEEGWDLSEDLSEEVSSAAKGLSDLGFSTEEIRTVKNLADSTADLERLTQTEDRGAAEAGPGQSLLQSQVNIVQEQVNRIIEAKARIQEPPKRGSDEYEGWVSERASDLLDVLDTKGSAEFDKSLSAMEQACDIAPMDKNASTLLKDSKSECLLDVAEIARRAMLANSMASTRQALASASLISEPVLPRRLEDFMSRNTAGRKDLIRQVEDRIEALQSIADRNSKEEDELKDKKKLLEDYNILDQEGRNGWVAAEFNRGKKQPLRGLPTRPARPIEIAEPEVSTEDLETKDLETAEAIRRRINATREALSTDGVRIGSSQEIDGSISEYQKNKDDAADELADLRKLISRLESVISEQESIGASEEDLDKLRQEKSKLEEQKNTLEENVENSTRILANLLQLKLDTGESVKNPISARSIARYLEQRQESLKKKIADLAREKREVEEKIAKEGSALENLQKRFWELSEEIESSSGDTSELERQRQVIGENIKAKRTNLEYLAGRQAVLDSSLAGLRDAAAKLADISLEAEDLSRIVSMANSYGIELPGRPVSREVAEAGPEVSAEERLNMNNWLLEDLQPGSPESVRSLDRERQSSLDSRIAREESGQIAQETSDDAAAVADAALRAGYVISRGESPAAFLGDISKAREYLKKNLRAYAQRMAGQEGYEGPMVDVASLDEESLDELIDILDQGTISRYYDEVKLYNDYASVEESTVWLSATDLARATRNGLDAEQARELAAALKEEQAERKKESPDNPEKMMEKATDAAQKSEKLREVADQLAKSFGEDSVLVRGLRDRQEFWAAVSGGASQLVTLMEAQEKLRADFSKGALSKEDYDEWNEKINNLRGEIVKNYGQLVAAFDSEGQLRQILSSISNYSEEEGPLPNREAVWMRVILGDNIFSADDIDDMKERATSFASFKDDRERGRIQTAVLSRIKDEMLRLAQDADPESSKIDQELIRLIQENTKILKYPKSEANSLLLSSLRQEVEEKQKELERRKKEIALELDFEDKRLGRQAIKNIAKDLAERAKRKGPGSDRSKFELRHILTQIVPEYWGRGANSSDFKEAARAEEKDRLASQRDYFFERLRRASLGVVGSQAMEESQEALEELLSQAEQRAHDLANPNNPISKSLFDIVKNKLFGRMTTIQKYQLIQEADAGDPVGDRDLLLGLLNITSTKDQETIKRFLRKHARTMLATNLSAEQKEAYNAQVQEWLRTILPTDNQISAFFSSDSIAARLGADGLHRMVSSLLERDVLNYRKLAESWLDFDGGASDPEKERLYREAKGILFGEEDTISLDGIDIDLLKNSDSLSDEAKKELIEATAEGIPNRSSFKISVELNKDLPFRRVARALADAGIKDFTILSDLATNEESGLDKEGRLVPGRDAVIPDTKNILDNNGRASSRLQLVVYFPPSSKGDENTDQEKVMGLIQKLESNSEVIDGQSSSQKISEEEGSSLGKPSSILSYSHPSLYLSSRRPILGEIMQAIESAGLTNVRVNSTYRIDEDGNKVPTIFFEDYGDNPDFEKRVADAVKDIVIQSRGRPTDPSHITFRDIQFRNRGKKDIERSAYGVLDGQASFKIRFSPGTAAFDNDTVSALRNLGYLAYINQSSFGAFEIKGRPERSTELLILNEDGSSLSEQQKRDVIQQLSILNPGEFALGVEDTGISVNPFNLDVVKINSGVSKVSVPAVQGFIDRALSSDSPSLEDAANSRNVLIALKKRVEAYRSDKQNAEGLNAEDDNIISAMIKDIDAAISKISDRIAASLETSPSDSLDEGDLPAGPLRREARIEAGFEAAKLGTSLAEFRPGLISFSAKPKGQQFFASDSAGKPVLYSFYKDSNNKNKVSIKDAQTGERVTFDSGFLDELEFEEAELIAKSLLDYLNSDENSFSEEYLKQFFNLSRKDLEDSAKGEAISGETLYKLQNIKEFLVASRLGIRSKETARLAKIPDHEKLLSKDDISRLIDSLGRQSYLENNVSRFLQRGDIKKLLVDEDAEQRASQEREIRKIILGEATFGEHLEAGVNQDALARLRRALGGNPYDLAPSPNLERPHEVASLILKNPSYSVNGQTLDEDLQEKIRNNQPLSSSDVRKLIGFIDYATGFLGTRAAPASSMVGMTIPIKFKGKNLRAKIISAVNRDTVRVISIRSSSLTPGKRQELRDAGFYIPDSGGVLQVRIENSGDPDNPTLAEALFDEATLKKLSDMDPVSENPVAYGPTDNRNPDNLADAEWLADTGEDVGGWVSPLANDEDYSKFSEFIVSPLADMLSSPDRKSKLKEYIEIFKDPEKTRELLRQAPLDHINNIFGVRKEDRPRAIELAKSIKEKQKERDDARSFAISFGTKNNPGLIDTLKAAKEQAKIRREEGKSAEAEKIIADTQAYLKYLLGTDEEVTFDLLRERKGEAWSKVQELEEGLKDQRGLLKDLLPDSDRDYEYIRSILEALEVSKSVDTKRQRLIEDEISQLPEAEREARREQLVEEQNAAKEALKGAVGEMREFTAGLFGRSPDEMWDEGRRQKVIDEMRAIDAVALPLLKESKKYYEAIKRHQLYFRTGGQFGERLTDDELIDMREKEEGRQNDLDELRPEYAKLRRVLDSMSNDPLSRFSLITTKNSDGSLSPGLWDDERFILDGDRELRRFIDLSDEELEKIKEIDKKISIARKKLQDLTRPSRDSSPSQGVSKIIEEKTKQLESRLAQLEPGSSEVEEAESEFVESVITNLNGLFSSGGPGLYRVRISGGYGDVPIVEDRMQTGGYELVIATPDPASSADDWDEGQVVSPPEAEVDEEGNIVGRVTTRQEVYNSEEDLPDDLKSDVIAPIDDLSREIFAPRHAIERRNMRNRYLNLKEFLRLSLLRSRRSAAMAQPALAYDYTNPQAGRMTARASFESGPIESQSSSRLKELEQKKYRGLLTPSEAAELAGLKASIDAERRGRAASTYGATPTILQPPRDRNIRPFGITIVGSRETTTRFENGQRVEAPELSGSVIDEMVSSIIESNEDVPSTSNILVSTGDASGVDDAALRAAENSGHGLAVWAGEDDVDPVLEEEVTKNLREIISKVERRKSLEDNNSRTEKEEEELEDLKKQIPDRAYKNILERISKKGRPGEITEESKKKGIRVMRLQLRNTQQLNAGNVIWAIARSNSAGNYIEGGTLNTYTKARTGRPGSEWEQFVSSYGDSSVNKVDGKKPGVMLGMRRAVGAGEGSTRDVVEFIRIDNFELLSDEEAYAQIDALRRMIVKNPDRFSERAKSKFSELEQEYPKPTKDARREAAKAKPQLPKESIGIPPRGTESSDNIISRRAQRLIDAINSGDVSKIVEVDREHKSTCDVDPDLGQS